jgi:hypothetical protein
MSDNNQPQINMTAYIKDAIVVLSFLAGIAGVYVKITEQVVKLEQKVIILEEKTKELKDSNQKLIDKIDTFRTTLNLQVAR